MSVVIAFEKVKNRAERKYLLAHFRECASLFCVSYSFLTLKNFYNYYKRSYNKKRYG